MELAEAPIVNAQARYGAVPVEKLWPGETVVCIGSGPSLTQADTDYCRGRARVIAIKHVADRAPWADVLYGAGCDRGGVGRTWWTDHGPGLTFAGLRYTLDARASQWASVLELDLGADGGLALDPSKLRSGHHSGFQAMNLAVHFGAAKIVLLGYDLQPTRGEDHYFGKHEHGQRPNFQLFMYHFPSIVAPLQQLGINVINATRETALELFPRMTIQEALA